MAARVIVFGPTGRVASIVARTARAHGATVFLAMRDISKPIPGLDAIAESRDEGYRRIQADLHKPESVALAINYSRATSAFVYVAHGSRDHMRATLEATKAAGCQFLVLLSSFTITKSLEDVEPRDRIPYVHAQVELNVRRVYGPTEYVALRVGAFATNTFRWAAGIRAGMVTLNDPETAYDFITPQDMGKVGGTLLVRGQLHGQNVIHLYGPRLRRQTDAISIVGAALGKRMHTVPLHDVKALEATDATADEGVFQVVLGPRSEPSEWFAVAYDDYQDNVGNVYKYTGEQALGFEEWVDQSIELFSR